MDAAVRRPLREALAGAAFGFALFDPSDRLHTANAWYEQAFGLEPGSRPTWEEIMRRCHATRRGVLIETSDIDGWLARVRTKYRQTPVRAFESDLADGRWAWVVETLQPDGWLSVAVSDVSTLK